MAAGLAIDPDTGKVYWADFGMGKIAFANLNNSGGGGQLPTAGATVNNPWGLAIDPAAGKLYWGNNTGASVSFANLDGSGGGNLKTTPLTPSEPDFPSLLEPPLGTGAPAISGPTILGSRLGCSQGSWAPDLLESYLYRAPQTTAYSWTRNGTPISGATSSSIIARSPGSYTCRVTASNHAGSTTQASGALTVPAPPHHLTTAAFGNQRITLTTPSPLLCTASTGRLAVTLNSTKIANPKGAKLKFSSAAVYIDKGVKHKRHKTVRAHNGQKKKVVVITYTANRTAHHVPIRSSRGQQRHQPGARVADVAP